MCPARSCLRVRGRSTCVATRVCLLHGRGAEGREGGGGDRVCDAKRSEDPGSLQVSTRVEDLKFIGYGTARCHSHGPSRPVPGRFVSVCAFACFSYRETWSESCESRSDMPPARPHGVTGPCCHFQAEVSPRAFASRVLSELSQSRCAAYDRHSTVLLSKILLCHMLVSALVFFV